MTYTVKLDLFEGPLDLLLHLIKTAEVDVNAVPIAAITDQYLAYLDAAREMNLDIAGEYLVMAATLMLIKSRALLPPAEEGGDEESGEGEDPQQALVRQLLEYRRYREVACALAGRPMLGRDVFAPAPGKAVGEEAAQVAEDGCGRLEVSLGDLIEALRAVLRRTAPPPRDVLRDQAPSIATCARAIVAALAVGPRLAFAELFPAGATRLEVIATFLALLELIRLRVVRAHQAERFGPIVIELAASGFAQAEASIAALERGGAWEGAREEGREAP